MLYGLANKSEKRIMVPSTSETRLCMTRPLVNVSEKMSQCIATSAF